MEWQVPGDAEREEESLSSGDSFSLENRKGLEMGGRGGYTV